jgi:DNA mismatch repair protein MutS
MDYDTTPLLKQYFAWQHEYEDKFGPLTVVLVQIGGFYECYQVFNDVGKVVILSDILNIQKTHKSKAKDEGPRNPKMLGFPDHSIDKFVIKLIAKGWTIIRVDQYDSELPSQKEKDRCVSQIYSPSTYIENDVPTNNYLVGVITEQIKGKNYMNFCAMDLTTGICKLAHSYDTEDDSNRAVNDLKRNLYSFNPSEVICNDKTKIEGFVSCTIHTRNIGEYSKLSYQNPFLEKIYGKTTRSPIEMLGLTNYPDIVTILVMTSQFAFEHDPCIVKKLYKPEVMNDEEILLLNADSIFQLNLVNNNNSDNNSLMKIIDHTATAMGKRLLRERILRPSTSPDLLNLRYSAISAMIDIRKEVHTLMRKICDVEKKHRKAHLGKLAPRELFYLMESYDYMKKTIILCEDIKECETFDAFDKFVDEIKAMFNIEKLENVTSFTFNFFNTGVHPVIDDLQTKIDSDLAKLTTIALTLSADVGKDDSVKVTFPANEDYYLSTTLVRGRKLQKSSPSFTYTATKSVMKITSTEINNLSSSLKKAEKKIATLLRSKFSSSLSDLLGTYQDILRLTVHYISDMDVTCSGAYGASKFAYNRPVIRTNSSGSAITVTDVRHPIIERIIEDEYIGNDLQLDDDRYGLLLYGLNSSGKSSLLRAMGCNIVMAQAGLYVAASTFEFTPFHNVLCKISCSDNLFKSESTFVSEIIELRGILKKADKYSMVLADELSNGTEGLSASSIVASTIMHMVDKRAVFLLSTHLHQLVELPSITELKCLRIAHLQMEVSGKTIEYSRKLVDGSGDHLYGLEVAQLLGLDQSFMIKAFAFRAELEGKQNVILAEKKSRYNSKVYIHECSNCGSQKDLQTHHLKEQHTADKDGIIDRKFHKNTHHNLNVLCKKCHSDHHNNSPV